MEALSVTTLVGLAGLAVGLAFGAVTRLTDFCALGALADMALYRDDRRLRSWLSAIAVAMLGTHALHVMGIIDIHRSVFLSPDLGWTGAVVGGLMFGYGTVMARGCGGRSLIRLAGGDLRALVTLVTLGVFAYMTLRGLTGVARVWLEDATTLTLAAEPYGSQGLPELIAGAAGLDHVLMRSVLVGLAGLGLLAYCLSGAGFRRSPRHLVAGLAIGVLVTAGWAATGWLGRDEFEPVALASLGFVRPIGDGLQYLMTFTGATVTFGVAAVGGTLAGGFLAALFPGGVRVRGFETAEEMTSHLLGGAMMGVGGVMALGCTIGQGVTGIATLSVGSIIALASILAGGALAIRRLGLDTADEGLQPAPGE